MPLDLSRTIDRLLSLRISATLIAVTAAALACDPGIGRDQYSVAPPKQELADVDFSSRNRVSLDRVLTIGSEEGPEEYVFGFISDVALGPGDYIYIADTQNQRVGMYDLRGRFKRWIGRPGSGPGEFLAPTNVVTVDSLLAIYDQRQARITLVDSSGVFRGSFPLPGIVDDFEVSPREGFIFTATGHDSVRAFLRRYDSEVLVALGNAPREDIARGKKGPPNGAVCARSSDRQVIYANPWIHELAITDSRTREYRRAIKWRHPLREERTPSAENTPELPRTLLLGLECTNDFIALAYLDMQTRRLFYDFWDSALDPLGRLQFQLGDTPEFPGFLADAHETSLLTFRTRPFSQVFLYRIRISSPR